MMKPLTMAQERVLEYVRRFVSERGYPPTVREICDAFGFKSPMAAKAHLDALERKGYIRRRTGLARGIELTGPVSEGPSFLRIPVLGRIRAGEPVYATEDIEDYIRIDQRLIPLEEGFGLRVEGQSMVGVGILPGDIVIVRPQPVAEPGDIVVALIGDEATVKRFYLENAMVVLKPENPEMSPLRLKPSEVKIIGKVIGLIRRF
ncbi:MAG: repressor LexA [Nitrospirae bacterium]|nr:MAG: repressor LexA [Nitrospirota bacterium]